MGWGCRENRERVRAYRTHPTCRLLHNLFSLQQPLTPTAARPLSRGRELERGQQAARLVFGVVRALEKIAAILGMPSPQPSPTGEGAGCSGFRRCRPSEKECRKPQRQEFFRQSLSQGRWNKRRKRFFRRPLNPSAGRVPQGTHAVGWDCSSLNPNSHPVLSPVGES